MKQLLWLVVAAAVITGCKQKENPPARAITPPSVAEAEAFAKEFARHAAPCKAAELDKLVDLDLLLARAVAGRTVPPGFMKGLRRGMGGVGGMLCRKLDQPDMTVTYLRTPMVDGKPRPWLRVVHDGVSYIELEVDKREGKVLLADVSLSGHQVSELIGELIDATVDGADAAATSLKDMKAHMLAKRWQEAHAVLKAMPPKLRGVKEVRLAELEITRELGDEVYVKALEDYARARPHDPMLALLQIDRALLQKKFDDALKYIDAIDKRVGGDPYLDVLRSNAYEQAGKPAEALAATRRAVEREPTLLPGWWNLLALQAAAGSHADAVATLETLRKLGANVSTEALRADERFAKLVESAEFTAWAAKSAAPK